LNQNSNLEQSTDLAAEIQDQMEERSGLNNRGVRQAGFMVLYKTAMPSVLVEAGYLSNPTEEKFLVSDKGQEYISSAIYRAFKRFRDTSEKTQTIKESEVKSDINNQPEELSYRIQIAVTTEDIGVNAPKFSNFNQVKMYRHGGMFKYTVGDEPSLNGAQLILKQVKDKGVKDAFIVIFRNGERVSQAEANRLLGK
jgi:N-acetylmuramoyl-L-alanine amidase